MHVFLFLMLFSLFLSLILSGASWLVGENSLMVRKFPVMSAVLMHLSPRGFLFLCDSFLLGFCLCCLILKFLFYSLDLLFLIGSASGDLGGSLFFCLFWWRAWFTSGLKGA